MRYIDHTFASIAYSSIAVAVLTLSGVSSSWAQEKHKYFYKNPPGIAKYTQNFSLDVGDVPGHQIRVFEVHSKFPPEAPVFDGIKVKESWSRQTTDYILGSGTGSGYTEYVLENGEKIFARISLQTHARTGQDGVKTMQYTTVTALTGGTGRFKGIRGTLLASGGTDLKIGTSNVQTDGEYWFEK
jgi:hypothetical protein